MLRVKPIVALAGAFLIAVPVVAQQPAAAAPPACDVDQMSPGSLALAQIARNKVLQAKSPDDAKKAIRDAMKNVFDKKSNENPLGRDFVAAQFLLLAIEYGGEVQTRGELNMPGDKNAKIDLVVSADSLLDIVEAAKPLCKEETEQWRQYKPFVERIRMAYDALSANQLDSAKASVDRALILSDQAPQPYDVLWRMAQMKGDDAAQIKYLKMTVDKLEADTANTRTRANLLFNLGRVQQDLADKESDAAKKAALYKAATDAYIEVIEKYPGGEEAPYAVNGAAVAWAMSKDSTLGVRMIDAAKPVIDKLSDQAASQAAILATQMSRTQDAATFFKAAATADPYWRDYLYNYAASLFDLKQSKEMLDVVGKLLQLDPTNPDNVLLYAYAYRGLADAATDAAAKKAYTDSSSAYITRSDGMKTKVAFSSFDRGKTKTTLAGEIENRDKTARSYTVEFQFVDGTGAVVDTKSVDVGPVAPGATGPFKLELTKGGVAGVKYAPIP